VSKRADSRIAPAAAPGTDVLTVEEFCAEMKVSKDTFYHWRKVGTAPVCHRLPNGDLRIQRADRDNWLARLRDMT
jgi:predicted site-specific integrase-resolvase